MNKFLLFIAIMEMEGQYIMNKEESINYMSEGEGK